MLVDVAALLHRGVNGFRLRDTKRLDASVLVRDRNRREILRLEHAEAHAVFLIFLLQTVSKFFIAFVRHDGQRIDLETVAADTVLIDAEAQATPDLLPLLHGARRLIQRANLEDVRIVPALAQRRVGEDEAQRCLHGKQAFLVFHDERVGIIVALRLAARVLRVAFLVHGKIAVVNVADIVEVLLAVKADAEQLVPFVLDEVTIARLEHLRIRPRLFLAVRVVDAIIRHLVDEEQRQHLDPHREQLEFLVEMRADRLHDLIAFQRQIIHRADGFARMEDGGIAGEIDVFRAGRAVDVIDDETVVDVAAFRFFIEVIARVDGDDFALDAALAAHVHFDARSVLLVIDGDEAQIGRVIRVFRLEALDFDLLDELELVAVLRVELVNEVMMLDVRRGVAEDSERRERCDGLFRLRRRIDGLRLVDDDDGMRGGDELDGLAAVQPVVGAVDDICLVFCGRIGEAAAESVDVDDHDLHGVARRKRADFVEFRAVVDECIIRQVVVEVRKMVARDLDGFPDALFDGEVRHDDDEFREAVGLMEFEQ